MALLNRNLLAARPRGSRGLSRAFTTGAAVLCALDAFAQGTRASLAQTSAAPQTFAPQTPPVETSSASQAPAATAPAKAAPAAPAAPVTEEQVRQLVAARAGIVRLLLDLDRQIDELPRAAAPLKRAQAALREQLDQLDQQIAAAQASPRQSASTPGAPSNVAPAEPRGAPRRVTVSFDTRVGFDRQTEIVPQPERLPVVIDVRRFVSSNVLTAEYPLRRNTTAALVVPYINQRQRASVAGRLFTARGRGVGDITLLLEHTRPDIARGTSLSLAAGMQFPTGSDPFRLSPGTLPTGEGFFQPTFRATVQKLAVPLVLYGSLQYSTALRRSVSGQSVSLPDSFGGEAGFSYLIGPQFVSQTSISLRKSNSPLLMQPGRTEGYLSQSLVYRSGGRNTLRGSVDVGLTGDSIDFFLGLGLRHVF